MKTKLIILLLVLLGALAPTAHAGVPVTKQQALEIARAQCSQYTGAEYYYLSDGSTTEWKIFVDAEPLKNWEHLCFVVSVPKVNETGSATPPFTKVTRSTPPEGGYVLGHRDTPIAVDIYRGEDYGMLIALPDSIQAIVDDTYALIINGGVNQMSNHERYWNDCSLVYELLVKKYGISKSHIFPLVADGDGEGLDMRKRDGTFVSQPLDLDFDNHADISLAATKANIQTTLQNILPEMGQDHHLFIFVVGPGGSTDMDSTSYIGLWGNERLYDHELAQLLTPFVNKYVNVNVVLGQSYSGGFIDDLAKVGCVATAACAANQTSSPDSSGLWDEFVYRWVRAFRGLTPRNMVQLNADTNGDGFVSMWEAFEYAKNHDSTEDTPQYLSTPEFVGEDLGFHHRARTNFIYIKDNEGDLGDEPNLTTDDFTNSPSIWVRNRPDGIEDHEMPFQDGSDLAYLYVKVHNRGKADWAAARWIHAYWGYVSPTFSQSAFKGREVYDEYYLTGEHLNYKSIKSIKSGQDTTYFIKWYKTDVIDELPDGIFPYSLVVKILSTSYDETFNEGKILFDIQGCSNQAMRNDVIITPQTLSKPHYVLIRNDKDTKSKISLEFTPQGKPDEAIFKIANIQMRLHDKLYTAWGSCGYQREGVEVTSIKLNNPLPIVRLKDGTNRIKAINMEANDLEFISIGVQFLDVPPGGDSTFRLELVQRDDSGMVLGKVPFIVQAPKLALKSINIMPTQGDEMGLTTNASDFESVTWFDARNEIVGQSESIAISPANASETYKVVGLTSEGEMATSTISLDQLYGIKRVVRTAPNSLEVELMGTASSADRLVVTSTLEGTTEASTPLAQGERVFNVAVPEAAPGVYTVSYMRADQVIGTKNIVLQ